MTDSKDSAPVRAGQAQDAGSARYPPSPCISLCTLDDDNICIGCGRTLEQISRWALMSKDEQWSIIGELAAGGSGQQPLDTRDSPAGRAKCD